MTFGIYLYLCVNFAATIVAYYRRCYDSVSLCLITNTVDGSDFKLNQFSANLWCKENSSSLATITDEKVQSAITAFFINSTAKLISDVIIDGKRTNQDTWTWINGQLLATQPKEYYDEYRYAFLVVAADRNFVSYYGQAAYKRKFICSQRFNGTSDSSCANGYQQMGMICFKMHRQEVTWYEARNLCLQELGSDLAIFDNGIPSLRPTSQKSEFYWIGLRREKWAWSNGQDLKYSNWSSSNPGYTDGDCLCLKALTGKWTNCDCRQKFRYVCIQDYASTTTEMTTPMTTKAISPSAPTTTHSSPSTSRFHSTSTRALDDNFSDVFSERPSNDMQDSDNLGMLLGLGVGIACLLIIIVVIVIVVCIKNRRSHSGDHEPTHGNSPTPMTYRDDAPNTVYALVVASDDQPMRSPSEKTPNQTVYAELDLEPKGKITRRASQPVRYPSERTPDQSVYAEVDLLPKRKTLGRAVGQQESDVYANSLQVDSVYANNAQTKV